MELGKNTKLVMIGDSITDCGRERPIGEAPHGLGDGYVRMVDALLTARYPELSIRVVNVGCGGNTVRDLDARWQTDVIEQEPDWLSIMIGINDVWRQFDHPLRTEWHVPLPEFESTLERLVAQTIPNVEGLVLMTPYFIEPNAADAMRARMDEYGEAVKRVAEKHGAKLVDTQAAFNGLCRHLHPMALAGDRVHPWSVGHMALARAFLTGVGYEW